MIALNRARTTFQRIADAKFFNGWIKRITPDVVVVQAWLPDPFDRGDDFSFQVFGNKKSALFRASLVAIQSLGAPPGMEEPHRSGSLYEFECHICCKITFMDATEQPRFNVEGVLVDVSRADGFLSAGAQVLDVGPEGLAVLTGIGLSKGDEVAVALSGHGERLVFSAEVRNCSPCRRDPSRQRTGMRIKQIDRLNAVRWKHFYSEVVEHNRAHWVPEAADLAAQVKPKF
ncbi:MAG TPA: hypothetical protein VMI31_16920 [Fimbriimonadaceae bacterium]|nr:hypothetical protein [Fimbriimonadaceae bacterium]